MTARRWHSGKAFVNSLKDLRDHPSTSLFTAGLFLLPSFGTAVLQNLTGIPLFGFVMFPVLIAATIWLQFCLITATRDYAIGQDPGVAGLLSKTANLGRLASFFGVKVILFLITLAAAIVAFVPVIGVVFAGLAGTGGNFRRTFNSGFAGLIALSLLIGVGAFLVVAVVIRFRYGLAGAVNVLEERSPPEALTRSRQLMRDRWWDLLLLLLILLGVGMAAFLIIGLPSLIVSFRRLSQFGFPAQIGTRFRNAPFLRSLPTLPLGTAIVAALSTYLLQVFMTTISVSSITNFYLGIRGEEAMMAPPPAALPTGGDLGPLSNGKHDAYSGDEQNPAGDDRRPGNLPE